MTPERKKKLEAVAKCRQPNITVILENVYDSHNIGAVMRSCDAIGIMEIFVLYDGMDMGRMKIGKRTSAGTRRWIETHLYTNVDACFQHIRSKYDKVYATHLAKNAKTPYELDLSGSVALLFGNEQHGVSEKALSYTDGNLIIPQVGMAQSLNISVAAAITLYEAYRQRKAKGYYDDNPLLSIEEQADLVTQYGERQKSASKDYGKIAYAKNKY